MPSYIVAFIKFVEKTEYAEDFLAGNLYCNTWKFFRDLESKDSKDKQRGDRLETAASIINQRIYKPLTRSCIPYRIVLEDEDDFFTPVFCLYNVFSKNTAIPDRLRLQNDKLRKFGQHSVVIRDEAEFIKRLEVNLPSFSYGVVEYLDFDNLTGDNRYALKRPLFRRIKKTFLISRNSEFITSISC